MKLKKILLWIASGVAVLVLFILLFSAVIAKNYIIKNSKELGYDGVIFVYKKKLPQKK